MHEKFCSEKCTSSLVWIQLRFFEIRRTRCADDLKFTQCVLWRNNIIEERQVMTGTAFSFAHEKIKAIPFVCRKRILFSPHIPVKLRIHSNQCAFVFGD